jgi:hypothetical protein
VGASEFDLVAASLRADAGDLRAFVEALAEKLSVSLPGGVKVDRKGSFLGGPKHVRRIALQLGDEQLELEHDSGRIACRRRTVVRGIALKNEEIDLDAWIDAVTHALVEEAQASERGREALARLLQ